MISRRSMIAGTLALPIVGVHAKDKKSDRRRAVWTPDHYSGERLARLYDPARNTLQEDGLHLSQLDDQSPNGVPIGAFGWQGHHPPILHMDALAGSPVVEFAGRQYLDTEGSIGVNGNQFTIVQVWKRMYAQNSDDMWTSLRPIDAAFSAHGYVSYADTSVDMMVSYARDPAGAGDYVTYNSTQNQDSDWNIHVEVWNGRSSFGTVNGVVGKGDSFDWGDGTDLSHATIESGISIGWDHGFPANAMEGWLAYFAILSDALPLKEVRKWEGFLAHHFNLTNKLQKNHPYKNNPPRR